MGHFYIELIHFRIVPSCNRRTVAAVNKYLPKPLPKVLCIYTKYAEYKPRFAQSLDYTVREMR